MRRTQNSWSFNLILLLDGGGVEYIHRMKGRRREVFLEWGGGFFLDSFYYRCTVLIAPRCSCWPCVCVGNTYLYCLMRMQNGPAFKKNKIIIIIKKAANRKKNLADN